jgi:hypothetical protein
MSPAEMAHVTEMSFAIRDQLGAGPAQDPA